MKYPCLVLDHDDTVVASAPTIHYPVFLQALKIFEAQGVRKKKSILQSSGLMVK